MPGLDYTLGLNANPAVAALEKFKGTLGGLAGALSLVGIGFGAFKSAEGFADSLKQVFDKGKELSALHAITGQSISDVVALGRAYSEAGLSAESVSGDIGKLQKALGGVNEEGLPTAGIFRQLGLNIAQLKGQSAIDELISIGGAVNKLGDEASRTAAVTQIFGREGTSLKAVFADLGGLNEARDATRGLGDIMQRDSGLFKAIANDLEALQHKVRGFFTGFADTISPVLLPLLDKLKGAIQLTGLGQQAGAEIATVARTLYGLFEQGHIGEAFGLAIQIGGAKAIDWISGRINELVQAFGGGVSSGWAKALADSFSNIKDLFVGLADIISGAITKGITAALDSVSVKGFKLLDPNAAAAGQGLGGAMQKSGEVRLQSVFDKLGKTDVGGFLGGMLKGFGHDTDDAQAALAKLTGKALAATEGLAKIHEAAKPIAGGATLQPLKGMQQMKPLTDDLARIGLFVGGNGGVLGQRAAEDTARNTGLMARSIDTLNRQIAEMHRDLTPRRNPGAF